MELKLRNFENLTILHVHGSIQVKNIPVLRVGIPSVKLDRIPLIVDFTEKQHPADCIVKIEALLANLLKEHSDISWVSPVFRGAIAKNLEEAMAATAHVDRFAIKSVFEYEYRLNELEAKEKALDERLGKFSTPENPYQQMLDRIEKLEWLKQVYLKSIKHDRSMIELFQKRWKNNPVGDPAELKILRKEILNFMEESGVKL